MASQEVATAACAEDAVQEVPQDAAGSGLVPPEPPEQHDHFADDNLTCAICLDTIAPCDLAAIPGCDHQYCVNCILFWATRKEAAWCPQCRVGFSQLRLHRHLDGQLRDAPGLESICLLKRTSWFQEYAQARENGRQPGTTGLLGPDHEPMGPVSAEDMQEYLDYERYFDDYDQDEEVETYYRSAAAGSARITLGNRRWGENGFVAAGRMRARPVQPVPSKAQKGKGGKGKAGPSKQAAGPSHASPASQAGSSQAGPSSSTPARGTPSKGVDIPGGRPSGRKGKGKGPAVPGGSWDDDEDLYGTSPGGRRARRNARRAAMDGYD